MIDGRRVVCLLVVLLLAFVGVGARVGQVQVLAAGRYSALGETQRIREVAQPAERGSIFDRNGRDLALSLQQRTVWANPRLIADPMHHALVLAPILGVDQAELHRRLSRDAAFVYLARKVDDAVADRVASLDLEGVSFIEEPERFLPAGDLAIPLLGTVGVDNIGLSGLEAQYDRALRGKPGRLIVEQDVRGGRIPGTERLFEPSRRGDDLVLTLDRSLQYETERALGREIVVSNARAGVAIVMETSTGDVLSLAALSRAPTSSPAKPPAAPDAQAAPPSTVVVRPSPVAGALQSRANTAFTAAYEPGSVSKPITIAAALEERVVGANDTLTVGSTIQVHDKLFSEHDPHPVVRWSITDVMANSSNVGTIQVGLRLGKLRMDRYLRRFGFGVATGLEFPGESRGILLPVKKWSGTTLPTAAIGQGVAVTPMQLVAAYNAIANGGLYVAPKLVRATVEVDGTQRPTESSQVRRVLSRQTAGQVTAMLTEVVRVGTGTQAAIDGYSVAGKTGTARKPRVGARGYKEGAYVASFAGFVPAERPALTILVLLDEPTPIYGGLVAAPVFAEIARYGLRQLRIPPPPSNVLPHAGPVRASSPSAARDVGDVGARVVKPKQP